MPPPRDIFGGDTPMGIGEAGMDGIPQWHGRDAKRGMIVGDSYLPPGREREDWVEGAGNLELSGTRATDYQNVEDVLLKGRMSESPPRVTGDVSGMSGWSEGFQCIMAFGRGGG